MSCGTSLYTFTIDIYKKGVKSRSNSGQVVIDWALDKVVSCDFMPARAEERLVGRQHNPLSYNIWVHGDEDITVDKQARNLKDSHGNIIEEGPFNIVGVRKHMGFFSVDYLTVNLQKVLS